MSSVNLSELNGKRVFIVMPYYGTQSISFIGILQQFGDKFQVSNDSLNILFQVDDVVKLDDYSSTDISKIIRLKGPPTPSVGA